MHTAFDRRRGFALGQIKLLVAGVLALAGTVLAIRGLMPTRSERTDAPKPGIVSADGSAPVPRRRERRAPAPADLGWTEPPAGTTYNFQRVSNTADARTLADAIGRAVDTSGEASDDLGGDLVGLLAPSLAGEGSVREAVIALGGEAHDTLPVLDSILQAVLEHVSADPAAITISTPDEDPKPLGGMSVNRNRTSTIDEDGNEVERDTISLMSSFERTFPAALADDASGRLRLVEIPMRSKGAKGNTPDMRLALTLRYNAAAKAWQPAAMKIDSTDADIVRRVMQAAQAAQAANNATPQVSSDEKGGN